MQTPVRIAYHGLRASAEMSEVVRAKATRLERYHPRITGCSVTLEVPGRHHRSGKHYRVRIELTVPGEKLVVGRDPAKTKAHEDLRAAVDLAFREARRQLEDHARRFDHRTRARGRATAARGRVARIFPGGGYGFLETPDGREIYFHERSVLDEAFARLRVGSAVRFSEEPGEKGPQASSVALARRPRRAA
jgi:ribosomal subunit interface protein